MNFGRRIRDLPGVLLQDVPRYRRALRRSGGTYRSDLRGWISLCNRIERVQTIGDGPGVECDWRWGSALHATEVLPALGRRMLGVALSEWPIRFDDAPRVSAEIPKVSFVFAHAGSDRLPQLRRSLRSIFAQREVPCECIVVDQSELPLFGDLPSPVVYRHLDKLGVAPGWHKAWALNIGARLAQGSILVFHDGDICAPADYAREIVRAIDGRGYAAASLQRLLFYLDDEDSRNVDAADGFGSGITPTMAFQNWKGGTIAIRKDAFEAIGGFDEGFVDWGGEDDEFFDRCAAVGHCRAGYLPFVHLWHPPQPDRKLATNANVADVLPWRLAIPHSDRIAELRSRRWGEVVSPDPAIYYKSSRQAA